MFLTFCKESRHNFWSLKCSFDYREYWLICWIHKEIALTYTDKQFIKLNRYRILTLTKAKFFLSKEFSSKLWTSFYYKFVSVAELCLAVTVRSTLVDVDAWIHPVEPSYGQPFIKLFYVGQLVSTPVGVKILPPADGRPFFLVRSTISSLIKDYEVGR